jgi:hypothetical protein
MGLTHMIASVAMMFIMHGAYKYANGQLSDRESAYLYDTGDHLAAVWAPALESSDASDPRFAEIIANGHQFKIKDLHSRNAQQYGQGFLIKRWREIEKERLTNDRVTRETAMNALRRRRWQLSGWPCKLTWNIGTSNPFSGTLEAISAMAN